MWSAHFHVMLASCFVRCLLHPNKTGLKYERACSIRGYHIYPSAVGEVFTCDKKTEACYRQVYCHSKEGWNDYQTLIKKNVACLVAFPEESFPQLQVSQMSCIGGHRSSAVKINMWVIPLHENMTEMRKFFNTKFPDLWYINEQAAPAHSPTSSYSTPENEGCHDNSFL